MVELDDKCAPELYLPLPPASLIYVFSLVKNQTRTICLDGLTDITCAVCEILKGKADTMTLEASKLSFSFDTAPLPKQGGEYQICFARLRASLNSTFSGSPAFNESFAPVFLYQDSRKVRQRTP